MSTWLISTNGLLLTAGNGLPSVGATPPPVATASAEITVSKRLVTATAPDMVVFEITNFSGFDTSGPAVGEVYNPRYHDLYYFWDFGDTTYSSFSAPTRVRSQHNNPNRMYGPWGRHVYRNAGSYSPKCTIYEPSSGKFAVAYLNSASTDSGTAGTATAALDVADPDTTFSGTNTIFMSPSGSFSNAPAGATTVTSADIDAVMGSNVAGQEATPKRLMLNRGESYTFSGYSIDRFTPCPTTHVVAGGDAGAKPVVTATGGWTYNHDATSLGDNAKDFVFDGIEWNGPYDSTTGTGNDALQFFGTDFQTPQHLATVLYHGCDFAGFGAGITQDFGDTAEMVHLALVDCTVTDWAEAGIYQAGRNYTTFLGSSIKSQELALVNTGGMGAPYRGNKTQHVVFACDIFSKQGSVFGGVLTEQPCLRINAEAQRDAETYVGCCVLEGGGSSNGMCNYTVSGVGTAYPCNHICEKNHMLNGARGSQFIRISTAGVTIRNNIFGWALNNNTGGEDVIVLLGWDGVDSENGSTPIKIYSNTVAMMRESGAFSQIWKTQSGNTPFNDVTSQNNIVHQPNATTPSDLGLADSTNDFPPLRTAWVETTPDYSEGTAHVAIDFDAQTGAFTAGTVLTGGTSLATARINYIQDNGTTGTLWLGEVTGGPFVNNETITDTGGGSATVNGSQRDSGFTDDFIPLTGSSVIGAYSTGLVAYDDFYGNIRDTVLSGLTRSAYSTGAHEPSLES